LQRQAGNSFDHDCIPRIGPVRADGLPALSANPHLALGTAVGHGHALGADKRQKAASPSSIVIPMMIAAIPQPVGRTKTARKMARMSASGRV
jgi:hypothetical protein